MTKLTTQRTERIKLYKAGKLWLTASLGTLVVGAAAFSQPKAVLADDTAQTTTTTSTTQANHVALQASATPSTGHPPVKGEAGTEQPSLALYAGDQTVTYTATYPDDTTTGNPSVTQDGGKGNQAFQAAFAMKAGDVATIFVPDALSGLQADDKAQQLHVVTSKTTQNGLSGTLFTFTAAEDGVMGPTFSFRKLTAPTDLKTAHTESYPVTLAINGEQQATLNYQNVVKIAHKHDTTTQQTVTVPAKQSALTLDQNQRGHANLVTNQQYVYGVGLTNEDHAAPLYLGTGEKVNASGSITVPAGFVLDGSGLVAEYNRAVGGGMGTLVGDENAPRTDEQLLTQTGTTLTLTNVALPVNQNWNAITTLMFWGHYTQPLSAEANQFTVDLTYAQKQAEQATTVTQPDGSTTTTHYLVQLMPTTVTAAIAKPVGTTPVATNSFGTAAVMNVTVAGQSVTAVYKDGLEANQQLASLDKDRINQPASGQLDAGYLNTGNIAQQNATLTFDYHGVKAVQFTLTAGDFAKLTRLTATYTDGTTVTSAPGQGYLGLDGTKGVAAIVAKYATIPAGQKLAAVLTSNGWADTPQAPGTSFDYTVSYVSDQQLTALTKAIPVLVLPYTEKAYGVDVDGWANSNGKLVHIGADVSAGVVLNPAYAGKIGRYAFTVPNNFAFDLASSTVTFTENGQETSVPLVKYATLLGPVGQNGELVYTLDFSDVVASKGVVNLALTVKQDALPGKMNFSDWFVQYDDPAYTADFITRHQATIGGQSVTLSGTALPLTPEILIPGLFENRNGIDDRMTPDVTYLRYDAANGAATTAHFLKAPTGSATASLDTSTMRLVTINSFTEASPWTQNLVVLPRKANGDAFDLVLADAGSITSDSTDTGELLYATTVPTISDGQLVLTDFVPGNQINDWSQVKSVILTTGQLGANTAVAAILPIRVADITHVDDGATVTFASTFKGVDRTGNVATNVQTMAATVIAAQTVTVRYVAQADDGTQTDIIQPQTTEYHVGDDYTTSALPTNLIPAGYALVATPANASGVVGDTPITVTYVYANPQAPVTTTQTKVVHQTIVYQFADHTPAAPSQTATVTFTRSVTRASNGGAVISTTPWQSTATTFAAKPSPTLAGYQPDVATVPAVSDLTVYSHDQYVVVTYRPLTGAVPDVTAAGLHIVLQDEHGNALGSDDLQSAIGNAYTYAAPTLGGYTYRDATLPDGTTTAASTLTGTLTAPTQTLTLIYRQNAGEVPAETPATLHIVLQDEHDNALGNDDLQAFIGNAYSYAAPTLGGYTYRDATLPDGTTTTASTLTGTLTAPAQTLTLIYQQNAGEVPTETPATLHIVLQDEHGNALGSDDLQSAIGNAFSYAAPTLGGYTYRDATLPDGTTTAASTLTGTLMAPTQTLTLIYRQNAGEVPTETPATLHIVLQDEHGNALGSDDLQAFLGNVYSYAAPTLGGYTYRDATLPDGTTTTASTLTGSLTASVQTLTLIYRQNAGEVPTETPATLHIVLQDEHGNALGNDDLQAFIGNAYSYAAPTLGGYTYRDATLPDGTTTAASTLTGSLTASVQTLTLIYRQNAGEVPTENPATLHIVLQDEHGNLLGRNELEGAIGNGYHYVAPTLDGYAYRDATLPDGATTLARAFTGTLTLPDQTLVLTYVKHQPATPSQPGTPTTPAQPTPTPEATPGSPTATPQPAPATGKTLPTTGDLGGQTALVSGMLLLALIGGTAAWRRKRQA